MEQEELPKKKDDTLTGFIVIGAVLALLLGFMYLLSIQKKAEDCTPRYNPDGSILVGCGDTAVVSPTPKGPVEFLDNLNAQTEDPVDKKLQEAAQDLQKQMNQQKQQQQTQQQAQPQVPQGIPQPPVGQ